AEDMGGHARAKLVRPRDGGLERIPRPARAEVSAVAVDPVADQLDPAVPAARLLLHIGDQLVRLDLPAVVADVALGPSDVPAGADDPGQVVTAIDPPGVGRRA